MKILNWNTWKATPGSIRGRFAKIRDIIQDCDADIICLTEAHPKTMPDGGQTITSRPGRRGWQAEGGPLKVVLWSRTGWTNIDDRGAADLPKGRFVSAVTAVDGISWNIVGMCIPYRGYPMDENTGEDRKGGWLGALKYLEVLHSDILPHDRYSSRTVLIGDFNLQIPAKNYPYPGQEVNRVREETFRGFTVPTAGEIDDPALYKRFIDHVALTPDIHVRSRQFFSRILADRTVLSDHNGVCLEIVPV